MLATSFKEIKHILWLDFYPLNDLTPYWCLLDQEWGFVCPPPSLLSASCPILQNTDSEKLSQLCPKVQEKWMAWRISFRYNYFSQKFDGRGYGRLQPGRDRQQQLCPPRLPGNLWQVRASQQQLYIISKIPYCQGQFRCPKRRVWPMLRPVQGPRRPQSLSVSNVAWSTYSSFPLVSGLFYLNDIFPPGLAASLVPTSADVSATWCSPPRWANTRNSNRPSDKLWVNGTEASLVRKFGEKYSLDQSQLSKSVEMNAVSIFISRLTSENIVH